MLIFKKKKVEKSSEDLDVFLAAPKTTWRQGVWEFSWEVIKVVIISVAIILPVRYFLIQPYYVKGASMEPNFYDHDYLIIDEISYRFREPVRGEVVVFRYPFEPRQYFIKRIVGLPEETVKISGGNLYIYNQTHPQGFLLNEDYLAGLKTFVASGKDLEVVLGSDEYFVLGDNRTSSLDSRSFGPLARKYLIGRTWIRGWPPTRLSLLQPPQYQN